MPLVDIDPIITRAAYLDSRVRLTERTWSDLIGWGHDANRRKGLRPGTTETTESRLRSLLLRAESRIGDSPDWAYKSFAAVWSFDMRMMPEPGTSTKPIAYSLIVVRRGDTLTIDARQTRATARTP